MHRFYRHSVWIDVFGIVLFGAVLLGGAGYLLFHAGGAAHPLGVSGQRSDAPSRLRNHIPQADRGPSPQGSRSRSILGSRAQPAPTRLEAPFSESWQKEATPELTGPSPSSEGEGTGGAAPEPSGPTIASRRPPGGGGGRTAQPGGASARAGWRTEARRFSGRARALSNQLRQMDRSSSEGKAESSSEEKVSKTASASRASSSASSDPGTPSDPSQVPIGGLGWLAAAGAAYALRRLGLKSEREG